MKLRQKLILLFIGVTVSLSAITSGIMFFQTKKSLDRKVVEYVTSIASNKAEYIDIFITDFKHKVKDMGNMSVINTKNVNEVVREFSGLVKNDDRIHTAYVGYADGLTIKNDGAMDPKNYNPLEKDWYKQAVKANGDIIVTNPYIDAFTGEKIITLSKDVGNNTVVALDIRLDTIFNAINKTKIGTTGYAILISGDGTVIYHPTQEYVDGGKNIKDLDDWGKDALTNMSGQLKSVNASKEESQIAYCKAKESGWVVAAILPESEYNADMKSGIKIDIAVVLLMVTASGALTIFILNKLIKDLDIVRDNMKEVEQGRLDIETKITRNDEIGEIERSFNKLTNSVRDMFSGVVGASDKTVNIVNNLRDIQGKNAEVNKVVGESVESIVVACENNSSSVEEINASMEELMSLQEQMAGDINELKDNSKETVTMAIEGASKVDSSVESMVEIDKATQAMHEIVTTLAEHSKNIDKIVDNISDISAQTNLLALNASIEAARAGDAGKGFSVVADEVRKLAEQSEASTDNISSILKEVLDGIETAVKSVENKLRLVKKGKEDAIEAKQYIQDIKNKINDLDNNIENINQKSSEQCVYIEEVGKATENVSESLEESVRMAEEIRNIRDSQDENISIMNEVVDELDKSSKELKNSTNKFIL